MRLILICGVAALGFAIVALSDLRMAGAVSGYIYGQQQLFHRDLADALRATGDGGLAMGWALVALSFLYGLFHAAGPGHGKAVIATYAGAQTVRLRQVVGLSLAAATLQGAMAIALVGGLVGLSGLAGRDAQAAAALLEKASFALVALLGAALAARALADGRRRRAAAAPHRCGCGHAHDPHATAAQAGWRGRMAVVAAAGLRPCTGAVLVLIFAGLFDLWWAGVASVAATSLGVSIAVGGLAAGAMAFGQAALRLSAGDDGVRAQTVMRMLALMGGLALCLIGVALFLGSPATRHPLF